jgi:cell wall-associated NlpC family hydrolase
MRCGVAVAPVRAAPDEAAEQVTQALLDEPLSIEEQRDGWARIVTTYGYSGWIRIEALEVGEGELRGGGGGTTPLAAARSYLGTAYEWGGLSERGIDCSGLVHIAFRLAGELVPRDAWQLEEAGRPVAPGDERAGDLVTYGDGGRADHIAFRTGRGRILHATARDGLGVVEEDEPELLRTRRRLVVRL